MWWCVQFHHLETEVEEFPRVHARLGYIESTHKHELGPCFQQINQ